MNIKLFALTICSAVLGTTTLIGCSNTAQGAEEDAKLDAAAAKEAAKKAGDTVKEKAPDVVAAVSLTAPIKLAFTQDKNLDSKDELSVSSDKDTVTLSGSVVSDADKKRAEDDAKKVLDDHKASQKLVNSLEVKAK